MSMARWVSKNVAEAEVLRQDAHSALVSLSREDPNTFLEMVLKDEETGDPIVQDPLHVELQRLAVGAKYLCVWAHCEGGKCEASGAPVFLADGSWRRIERIVERTKIAVLDPVRRAFKIVEAGPVEANG